MREDALPADEFKLLDERLARWTADQQRTGKLPPDYELRAKSPALAREFLNNRDEARPIFTVEEQRDVDASRAASSLRDRIDDRQDLGASLRQVSVQYAVTNALGELEARKRVSDRFGELYGKSPGDYGKEQRREPPRNPQNPRRCACSRRTGMGQIRACLPALGGLQFHAIRRRDATARSARKNTPNGKNISTAGWRISAARKAAVGGRDPQPSGSSFTS